MKPFYLVLATSNLSLKMAALSKPSRDYQHYLVQKKLELMKKGKIHEANLELFNPDIYIPVPIADILVEDDADALKCCALCKHHIEQNSKGKLKKGASILYNAQNERRILCKNCRDNGEVSLEDLGLVEKIGKI